MTPDFRVGINDKETRKQHRPSGAGRFEEVRRRMWRGKKVGKGVT